MMDIQLKILQKIITHIGTSKKPNRKDFKIQPSEH